MYPRANVIVTFSKRLSETSLLIMSRKSLFMFFSVIVFLLHSSSVKKINTVVGQSLDFKHIRFLRRVFSEVVHSRDLRGGRLLC